MANFYRKSDIPDDLQRYFCPAELGLEETPQEYVTKIVTIFDQVKRVLRDDGTLWLNLGDSYAANRSYQVIDNKHIDVGNNGGMRVPDGLKPKDLIGIPWRVAFALQGAGWYLRSDIIWAKPNPMPESVRDRPTKAHEYIFLLTKKPKYYFDHEAFKEPISEGSLRPQQRRARELAKQHGLTDEHIAAIRAVGATDVGKARVTQNGTGKNLPEVQALADEAKAVLGGYYREFLTIDDKRNRRTVWNVATKPFKEAHFAVFPTTLIEPCIWAGTPSAGCCAVCGVPWKRIVKRKSMEVRPGPSREARMEGGRLRTQVAGTMLDPASAETLGWEPGCKCGDTTAVPAVVLDPFAGSGTTGIAALSYGQDFIGVDLKPEYIDMARRRIHAETGIDSTIIEG